MSLGIVTFHRALNYGALLQAYALKEAVRALGHDAKIVDYRCPVIEKMYYYPTFFERKGLKSRLKYLVQGGSERLRRERFEKFRREYLSLSESVYTEKTVKNANSEFSAFITGSDQVFSYLAHEFDENFFLTFAPEEKRNSYAASFGIAEIPKEYEKRYAELLSSFSNLSVREEQGIKILRALGIDRGRVDIDPTLLLSKDEWLSRLGGGERPKKPYIFAYYFDLTESMRAYIENMARETGYEVLYLGHALRSPFKCKSRAIRAADPIDFVKAVAGAAAVVTNSFHGTVFSIIFNRPLFVELLKRDSRVNSRLENILKTFSLENRIIGKEIGDIDWNRVNTEKDLLRQKSIEYLKEIIK